MKVKNDIPAERFILSALAQKGLEALAKIEDVISTECFSDDKNKLIFESLRTTIHTFDRVDLNLFLSTNKDLGFDSVLSSNEDVQYVRTLFNGSTNLDNTRSLAVKLKKLEIGKRLQAQLSEAHERIGGITGNESISDILGIAEDPALTVEASITGDENEAPTKMFEDCVEYLEFLEENPVDQVGISSGHPIYDQMIGGGFRDGYINLVVARPKAGKSTLAVGIGTHIARNDIPVLYLDTEMDKRTQQIRKLSAVSMVKYDRVETGKFKEDPKKLILYAKAKELTDIPLYYKRIAGKRFEEIISIMRRWIQQVVGKDENGETKPCMIIYDYFKLMNTDDLQDLQEHQALGFQLSSMTDFLGNYNIPCLAFVQANRAGIKNDTTDIVSQSDRLTWFCASLALLRKKSNEEQLEEGVSNGDTKIIPMDGMRFSKGLDGAHINYSSDNFEITEIGISTAEAVETYD